MGLDENVSADADGFEDAELFSAVAELYDEASPELLELTEEEREHAVELLSSSFGMAGTPDGSDGGAPDGDNAEHAPHEGKASRQKLWGRVSSRRAGAWRYLKRLVPRRKRLQTGHECSEQTYAEYLLLLPDDWEDPLRDASWTGFKPRFLVGVRVHLFVMCAAFGVPATYLTLTSSSLGLLVAIAYFLLWAMSAGIGGGIVFVSSFLVWFLLALCVASFTAVCTIVNKWFGLVSILVVFCLFAFGRAGKCAQVGITNFKFVALIWNFVFFGIFEFLVSGISITVPYSGLPPISEWPNDLASLAENVIAVLQERLAMLGLSDLEIFAQRTESGLEVGVLPGMWMISKFLWSTSSALVKSSSSILIAVLVGASLYFAAAMVPPHMLYRGEARHLLGRLQYTLARMCAELADGAKVPRKITQEVIALSNVVTDIKHKMKAATLEPTPLTPSLRHKYDSELMEASESAHSIIIQMSTWALCRHELGLGIENDDVWVEFQQPVFDASRALLEHCAQTSAITPYSWHKTRARVEAKLAAFDDLETALLDSFSTLDWAPYMQNASTDSQRAAINARQCLLHDLYLSGPIRLSKAVRRLCVAELEPKSWMVVVKFLAAAALGPTLLSLKGMIGNWALALVALLRWQLRWRGPDAWFFKDEVRTGFKMALGIFILAIPATASDVYRTWTPFPLEGAVEPILNQQAATRLEMWSILQFVQCSADTFEGAVWVTLLRTCGGLTGILFAWAAGRSAQDSLVGVIAWQVLTIATFVSLQRDPGGRSRFTMNPIWGTFFRNAIVFNLVVLLNWYLTRETYTIEYYVVSRTLSVLMGGSLQVLLSLIFSIGGGWNARAYFINALEHLRDFGIGIPTFLTRDKSSDAPKTSTPAPPKKLHWAFTKVKLAVARKTAGPESSAPVGRSIALDKVIGACGAQMLLAETYMRDGVAAKPGLLIGIDARLYVSTVVFRFFLKICRDISSQVAAIDELESTSSVFHDYLERLVGALAHDMRVLRGVYLAHADYDACDRGIISSLVLSEESDMVKLDNEALDMLQALLDERAPAAELPKLSEMMTALTQACHCDHAALEEKSEPAGDPRDVCAANHDRLMRQMLVLVTLSRLVHSTRAVLRLGTLRPEIPRPLLHALLLRNARARRVPAYMSKQSSGRRTNSTARRTPAFLCERAVIGLRCQESRRIQIHCERWRALAAAMRFALRRDAQQRNARTQRSLCSGARARRRHPYYSEVGRHHLIKARMRSGFHHSVSRCLPAHARCTQPVQNGFKRTKPAQSLRHLLMNPSHFMILFQRPLNSMF
ncbi:hypothetical protein FVE85_9133 [Porphyridium purpureum]|uniref:Uncharacterized protein n=1 Tax=Porphyridium purpureum TaxID=35688 RepID=A0A5J4YMY3_PORPP|nr:hypothetical protein FVE85_9133 [Porphyridium purpureum]|eukprot:POR3919..scf222_8